MKNSNWLKSLVYIVVGIVMFAFIIDWFYKLSLKTRIKIVNWTAAIILIPTFIYCIVIFVQKIQHYNTMKNNGYVSVISNDQTITDYQKSSKYLCTVAIQDVRYTFGQDVDNENHPHHERIVEAKRECQASLYPDNPKYKKRLGIGTILFGIFLIIGSIAGLFMWFRIDKWLAPRLGLKPILEKK